MNNNMLLIVLLLLFVSACSAQTTKPIPDVRSGTQGLEVEFLKNAPPALVFEESNFPAILRVKNLGAFSIEKEPAILSLGVERDYTKKIAVEVGGRVTSETPHEAMFTLPGKTLINPKGDEEVISFTLTPSKIDPQSETHPTTLIATVCYPYQTELITSVCIDPDPNNVRPVKKSCTVQDSTFPQGQGAPVSITLVQPQIIPSDAAVKPQFLITIENKGKGEVIKPGLYTNICRGSPSGVDAKELNRIGVKAWLSTQELACSLREDSTAPSTEGFARLQSQKQVIRCSYPENAELLPKSSDTYTTQLRIVLDYGYVESKPAEYAIKKVSVR
jgi:hypothetical protein